MAIDSNLRGTGGGGGSAIPDTARGIRAGKDCRHNARGIRAGKDCRQNAATIQTTGMRWSMGN